MDHDALRKIEYYLRVRGQDVAPLVDALAEIERMRAEIERLRLWQTEALKALRGDGND